MPVEKGKPLGNPAANGIKFFDTTELLELGKDHARLVKVTNAINQRWQKRVFRLAALVPTGKQT